jgi:ABC-type amino acid transport substrate-binding protein
MHTHIHTPWCMHAGCAVFTKQDRAVYIWLTYPHYSGTVRVWHQTSLCHAFVPMLPMCTCCIEYTHQRICADEFLLLSSAMNVDGADTCPICLALNCPALIPDHVCRYTASAAAQLTAASMQHEIRSVNDLRGKAVVSWDGYTDKLREQGIIAIPMPWCEIMRRVCCVRCDSLCL